MTRGKVVVGVVALCLVALAASYSPQTAERLIPGAGTKAGQLRAALPDALFARLDDVLPAAVKSWLPAEPEKKVAGTAAGATGQPRASGAGGNAPAAGGAPPRPPVSVIVGQAVRKLVPVRIDAIGTVQPMASVSLRSRVDTQIDQILVGDGAPVKAGEMLVKLDSRQVEAQLRQAEATLAKDRATLEQNIRDVTRFTELVATQATTKINLDNAKTAVATTRASIQGDEAAVDNLRVQITFYSIRAPISGRVGTFTTKAGNIARQGEAATALATINQTSPIYVVFSVPQRNLGDLREAMASPDAKVEATPQGSKKSAFGKVSVIDNAIDAATGTISIRAQFENADEMLWPGQLCNIRVTLRVEPNTLTVPREAVQVGQTGNYVFVVEDGVAKVRSVTVARIQDTDTIITDGLKGGETVVTEGALLLSNNARVEIRNAPEKKSAS